MLLIRILYTASRSGHDKVFSPKLTTKLTCLSLPEPLLSLGSGQR